MKNDEYSIFPYTTVDGMPTMRDSDIGSIYRRISKEGTLKHVFLNGVIRNELDLINMFRNPDVAAYLLAHENDILGFFWLDNFAHCTCYAHQVIFKKFWGPIAQGAGRKFLDFTISMKNSVGEPIVSVILGMVPAYNRVAIKFAKTSGMAFVGVIPNYFYNFYKDELEDGHLFTFVKED